MQIHNSYSTSLNTDLKYQQISHRGKTAEIHGRKCCIQTTTQNQNNNS